MNSLRKKLTSTLAVVTLTLFSFANLSKAQCPDASGPAPDPAVIPWVGGYSTYQQIGTTGCWVTIDYCERTLADGSVQVWIEDVIPDAGGPCDGLSNDAIIRAACDLVDNDLNVNGGVICLKGGVRVVHVYTARCWSLNRNPSPIGNQGPYGLNPCMVTSWCSKTCEVCADNFPPHMIHLSNCTYTDLNVGVVCPAPPGIWPENTCFTIGCPNQ